MANTSILIKRSTTTGRPASLSAGEFAYSYQSNTLFMGSPAGTGVINVGGQYYTSTLDAATSANTAGTLVKRDSNNNFYGGLYGNANTATALLNSRNFSISGGDITASAVGFDGTGAVTLSASLDAVTGLSAGVYGGTTAVPVVTVAANGRIMSIANTSISTSFTVSGNTGSGTQAGGGTLTVRGGGTGITTTVTGSGGSETIEINTDNTVVRSNTASLNQTIDGNITVSGNLTVLGTETIINVNTFEVSDPLIYLAGNNYTSDAVDIGFVANYNNGAANLHAGFIRHAGDKDFYVFDGYNIEPGNNVIDITGNGFNKANVNAGIFKGNLIATTASVGTLTLSSALSVPNGGTGATTLGAGQILIGNGTGAVTAIANVGTAGAYGSQDYIPVITTDAYGRVTAVSNTAIAIDASQINRGTLGVARGGTGAATFTNGSILVGSGTDALATLANSTYTATGSGGADKTITSVTVDSYGRLTAATFSSISGLTVGQGGTGVSTFTTNGITFGNGTSALGVTAAAGTSDQTWSNQILTTTNAGVPVWSTALDGGQF
jgi:hypothetical protein